MERKGSLFELSKFIPKEQLDDIQIWNFQQDAIDSVEYSFLTEDYEHQSAKNVDINAEQFERLKKSTVKEMLKEILKNCFEYGGKVDGKYWLEIERTAKSIIFRNRYMGKKKSIYGIKREEITVKNITFEYLSHILTTGENVTAQHFNEGLTTLMTVKYIQRVGSISLGTRLYPKYGYYLSKDIKSCSHWLVGGKIVENAQYVPTNPFTENWETEIFPYDTEMEITKFAEWRSDMIAETLKLLESVGENAAKDHFASYFEGTNLSENLLEFNANQFKAELQSEIARLDTLRAEYKDLPQKMNDWLDLVLSEFITPTPKAYNIVMDGKEVELSGDFREKLSRVIGQLLKNPSITSENVGDHGIINRARSMFWYYLSNDVEKFNKIHLIWKLGAKDDRPATFLLISENAQFDNQESEKVFGVVLIQNNGIFADKSRINLMESSTRSISRIITEFIESNQDKIEQNQMFVNLPQIREESYKLFSNFFNSSKGRVNEAFWRGQQSSHEEKIDSITNYFKFLKLLGFILPPQKNSEMSAFKKYWNLSNGVRKEIAEIELNSIGEETNTAFIHLCETLDINPLEYMVKEQKIGILVHRGHALEATVADVATLGPETRLIDIELQQIISYETSLSLLIPNPIGTLVLPFKWTTLDYIQQEEELLEEADIEALKEIAPTYKGREGRIDLNELANSERLQRLKLAELEAKERDSNLDYDERDFARKQLERLKQLIKQREEKMARDLQKAHVDFFELERSIESELFHYYLTKADITQNEFTYNIKVKIANLAAFLGKILRMDSFEAETASAAHVLRKVIFLYVIRFAPKPLSSSLTDKLWNYENYDDVSADAIGDEIRLIGEGKNASEFWDKILQLLDNIEHLDAFQAKLTDVPKTVTGLEGQSKVFYFRLWQSLFAWMEIIFDRKAKMDEIERQLRKEADERRKKEEEEQKKKEEEARARGEKFEKIQQAHQRNYKRFDTAKLGVKPTIIVPILEGLGQRTPFEGVSASIAYMFPNEKAFKKWDKKADNTKLAGFKQIQRYNKWIDRICVELGFIMKIETPVYLIYHFSPFSKDIAAFSTRGSISIMEVNVAQIADLTKGLRENGIIDYLIFIISHEFTHFHVRGGHDVEFVYTQAAFFLEIQKAKVSQKIKKYMMKARESAKEGQALTDIDAVEIEAELEEEEEESEDIDEKVDIEDTEIEQFHYQRQKEQQTHDYS